MSDPRATARSRPAAADESDRTRHGALRSIAAFEALKGVVAIAAGFGALSLLHRDLHHIALALIGRIGLDPGSHYPATLLTDIDRLQNADVRFVVLAVLAYALVRFSEAYGLWHARAWGEWLGALSGAMYVPFELRHVVHTPSIAAVVVVAFNIGLVAYLGWQLRERRRRSAQAAG